MTLELRKLHSHFVAEVDAIDLRNVDDPKTLQAIRTGMDEHAVLVFRDQSFSNDEQLAFAERLDGKVNEATVLSVFGRNRFGRDAVTDVSNLDSKGDILEANDRRRMMAFGNRLWHTDASFRDPCGRYSMLFAVVVPPVAADTEFADMRAAYDALDDATKARIRDLKVFHSMAYSRHTLGFEFTPEEQAQIGGANQPLVRTIPRSDRRSLYLASHASHVVDWPIPEGRLLLRDLTEHATQPEFIYRHSWKVGDFVIWDNRATMHRGRAYDDKTHRRDLRRVTTLDVSLGQGSRIT
jgi:alpha-ketoglutarate-dependent 2,4-dichlorophenoxyacetate dioxygenase